MLIEPQLPAEPPKKTPKAFKIIGLVNLIYFSLTSAIFLIVVLYNLVNYSYSPEYLFLLIPQLILLIIFLAYGYHSTKFLSGNAGPAFLALEVIKLFFILPITVVNNIFLSPFTPFLSPFLPFLLFTISSQFLSTEQSLLIAKSSGNAFLIFLPVFVFEAFFVLKNRSLFFHTDKVPFLIITVEFLMALVGLVVGISVFIQWQYTFIRWQQVLIVFSLVWTIFFLTLSFSDLRKRLQK